MAIDWQSRRDGFDHRRDKPTDRPINWKYWASLQDWKQWDAFALSLNINPENMTHSPHGWMAGPGSGPTFLSASFPNRAVELEFNRRLTMFGRVIGGRPLATVHPPQFAAWCLSVGLEALPLELVALAATTEQPAPAKEVATPRPVVAGASVDAQAERSNSKKARRDSIDAVIELAQSKCRNQQDTAEVWPQMERLAQEETPPFLASMLEGLKYSKQGEVAYFTRDALDKRLHPEKRATPGKRR